MWVNWIANGMAERNKKMIPFWLFLIGSVFLTAGNVWVLWKHYHG